MIDILITPHYAIILRFFFFFFQRRFPIYYASDDTLPLLSRLFHFFELFFLIITY